MNNIEAPDGIVVAQPSTTIVIGSIEFKLNKVCKFHKLDHREPTTERHGEPVEQLVEVLLFEDGPSKICKICSTLIGQLRTNLINFLYDNHDVFAWSHEDMLGIDPEVIVHRLNIGPSFGPAKQKL